MLELFGFHDLWGPLIALTSGTLLGMLYGVVPGIGGRVGILISLPIAMLFDPSSAAIFLFAMHSVVHTATSIPAIAFGVPSGSSDAATVVDGYPLAKMGRAGEALGASLSASAIGGVLGALAFLAAIPVARLLITSFGPPEVFVLSLFGLTMVASLSREGLLPGLAVACVGILFAMVGYGVAAAEPRFTFGILDLWGGLQIPALICGMFVVPEMLTIKRTADTAAQDRAISTRLSDVFRGLFVTFRHKAVLLRSTFYGIIVGLTPAVGSSVSVWMSYGYAAQTTKSEIPFGKGAIAGVIAPEAANNSKEGGAMIPTLFFGIPGSSSMAIMMAALGYVGVNVGPEFLKDNLGLAYALAATILLANLIAVPTFFAMVPPIVRLSALRRDAIAPIAIALSATAALISAPRLSTVLQIAAATGLGIALKWAGWPRAPFILGFVLGRLAERAFTQTMAIWGWSFVTRPVAAALLVALAAWLAYVIATRPVSRIPGSRVQTLTVAAILGAIFLVALTLSTRMPYASAVVPFAASAGGLVLLTLTVTLAWRSPGTAETGDPIRHVAWFALFLLLMPWIGLIAASGALVVAVLIADGTRWRNAIITGVAVAGAQWFILSAIFDVLVEREIIGRIGWYLLGY